MKGLAILVRALLDALRARLTRRRRTAEPEPEREPARPVERITTAVVVAHITRGNVAVTLPIPALEAETIPVGRYAEAAALAVFELQQRDPARADEPILPDSDVELALRPRGADEPLDPDRPILPQTPGHWRAENLPVKGQHRGTARLPVGAFELVDLDRPRLRLATPPSSPAPPAFPASRSKPNGIVKP